MLKKQLFILLAAIKKNAKYISISSFVSLFVTGLILSGFAYSIDDFFEDVTTNAVQTRSSEQTAIVAIDAKTIRTLGGYPLERKKIATALNHLNSYGANKVYVDISFGYEGHDKNDNALLQAMQALGKKRLSLPVSTVHALDENGTTYAKSIMFSDKFSAYASKVSADLSLREDYLTVDAVGQNSLGQLVDYPTIADWFFYGQSATPKSLKIDYGIQVSTIPVISFLDILNKTVSTDAIKGKNIILGVTAPQIVTPLNVPQNKALQRPVIIALSTETRALGQDIEILSKKTMILFSIALVFFLGLVLQRYSALVSGAITLTVLYSLIILSIYLRERWLLNISLGGPFFGGVAVYAAFQFVFHPVFAKIRSSFQFYFDKIDFTHLKLLHTGKDAIVTFSSKGELLTMNNSAELLFKKNAVECVGQSIKAILPQHADILLKNTLAQLPGRLEANIQPKESTLKYLDMAYNALPTEDDWVGLVSIRDITVLKKREKTLLHASTHDDLTGLANRSGFDAHIKKTTNFASQKNKPFCVLMIDLDKFKYVNDTMGHHIGDVVLQTVAKRLNMNLRESDFAARMGGDEFAVIMDAPATSEGAEILAKKLVKSLSEPILCEGHVASIGASIGIAIYGEHTKNLDRLMQYADEAMYHVKKCGRNGYFVAQP